jgi:lipopolysaccharide export LptBFGC system permease protein LptF
MSWTRLYRLALLSLPAGLRRKHGPAMESLFACELERARGRGRLFGALGGAAGIWDAIQRGAYERLRVFPKKLSGAHLGGPSMPNPTTRQVLLRHAAAFAVSFVVLTSILLANSATMWLPTLRADGASAGTLAGVLLFALPHTAALTIPMAVFLAVLWVFTRLGAEGALAAARAERGGVRRLVGPVLGAAFAVAALTLVLNAEILPRANGRLAEVLAGRSVQSDRTMTIAELRAAVRSTRADAGPGALERAAAYEVEVQKKYALAGACVVLALAAAAIALRFPRGRVGLIVAASFAVFGAYWVCLIVGETLADRQAVSPFVAMWAANGLLLAVTLLAMGRSRGPLTTRGIGPLAIGG